MGTGHPVIMKEGETLARILTMAVIMIAIEGVDHITRVDNQAVTNTCTNQNLRMITETKIFTNSKGSRDQTLCRQGPRDKWLS